MRKHISIPLLFRAEEPVVQRSEDLIRELLLRLEALPLRAGAVWNIRPGIPEMQVDGFSVDQIAYHLNQIRMSGFVDEGGSRPIGGIGFRALTPSGHDFLDSVRNPETWKKTKKAAESAGGFTLELLGDLAKGFIKKQIEERTGVKL